MGTWGAGVFSNDRALDYLAVEIIERLKQKMTSVLGNPRLAEPDEPTSPEILAAVEVMTLLCEHCKAVPPEPNDVKKCHETYLEVWEGYIDRLSPKPGFKEKQRDVINATFSKLQEQAEAWHK